MKKALFIALLFCATTMFAQYSWTPAVVTLNTGETLEGEAKLVKKGYGFNATSTELKFKSSDGETKEKFKSRDVDNVIFTNKYTQKINGKKVKKTSYDRYLSVDTKRYDDRIFLQEILKDKVSIYAQPVKNYKKKIASDVFPASLGEFTIVYLKKDDSSARLITVLGLDGYIQEQRAADYLANCPMTLDFIKEKDGVVNAVELANYYNSNCN